MNPTDANMADHNAAHGFDPRIQSRASVSRAPKRSRNNDAQDVASGICRICRSEGTPDEPLFYPCRCSGSIQHVHQDCLMEWLSHSQKKYCELCKTPFRFTKFYNPNMPSSLPAAVFIRQVCQYIIEHGLGWLRAAIAVSFWVAGLPWFMRRGWSAMLWLSQESWGGAPVGEATSPGGSTIYLSSTMIGFDMCPASPLFAPTMTPAANVASMMSWWANQTVTQFFVHCICWMVGIPSPSLVSSVTARTPPIFSPPLADTKSLLSSISFLKTLTRSAALNQELISVLEGQIITVVVIVSFILIILVRDYVVQQQPEINMRGAFEEPEDIAEAPVVVEPARAPYVDDVDGSSDDELETPPRRNVIPPEPSLAASASASASASAPASAFETLEGGEGASHAADERGGQAESESLGADWTPSATISPNWTGETAPYEKPGDDSSTGAILTPDHSGSDVADRDASADVKGKGKDEATPLVAGQVQSNSSSEPEAGPVRPRSISDGPQRPSGVNPLANNTWSFTSEETERDSDEISESAGSLPGADPAEASLRAPENLSDALRGDAGQGDDLRATDPAREAEDTSASQSEPAAAAPARPKPMMERVTDFMWGDVVDVSRGVEGMPPGLYTEEDWLDIPIPAGVPQGRLLNEDSDFSDDSSDEEDDDPGIDPEAIEDMEDFEGIMELLGMRGPVANLFQNVIFCAVLVQAALFLCVFIPFNIGRITFWFGAQPARVVLMLFEVSKVMQDVCFALAGFLFWVIFNLADMITSPLGGPVAAQILSARKGSWGFFAGAVTRVGTFFEILSRDLSAPGSGMQLWSAASHEALMGIRKWVSSSVASAAAVFTPAGLEHVVVKAPHVLGNKVVDVLAILSRPGSWIVSLTPDPGPPVDLDHASWPAADIAWAILAGYLTISLVAGLFLKTGVRIARGTALEEWEAGVVDTLHQASGILKVITIIGIEMLMFPLYCGLLLDCALLPLFADASINSRLQFTYNNPWTSIFVHWFVGTGYMFHFALFVSMCRKLMRPGVLCKPPAPPPPISGAA